MIEIHTGLFVGNQADCVQLLVEPGSWRFVHACKEPHHRQLLGYTGRGAPKEHPEYFFARRGNRLYLNLVDAPKPEFIPKTIVDAALAFIDEALGESAQVLVHCNQGESRSPSIGLLYLASRTDLLSKASLEESERLFRLLYPTYNPAMGIRGFMETNWDKYVNSV